MRAGVSKKLFSAVRNTKIFVQSAFTTVRATFGESSPLKLIGKEAFHGCGVCEARIPDVVEELCEGCFSRCRRFSRVTFGESSSLKLIREAALREVWPV